MDYFTALWKTDEKSLLFYNYSDIANYRTPPSGQLPTEFQTAAEQRTRFKNSAHVLSPEIETSRGSALHDIYAQILVAVGNHRKEELAKNLYADKHLHHTHLASNMAPTHARWTSKASMAWSLLVKSAGHINYILDSTTFFHEIRSAAYIRCTFETHSAINRNLDFYTFLSALEL